jgi:hypothetical protein
MTRSPLLRLTLALAVAWGAWAVCAEVGRALTGWDRRTEAKPPVILWREGMPAVVQLRQFADAARPLLERGSVVAFHSPDDGPGQQVFRGRWAAYLLPEVDIVLLTDPAARSLGRHLLAYGERLDHPRLALVRRLPGGWLYRIRP